MSFKEYEMFIQYIKENGTKTLKLVDLQKSIRLYKVFSMGAL